MENLGENIFCSKNHVISLSLHCFSQKFWRMAIARARRLGIKWLQVLLRKLLMLGISNTLTNHKILWQQILLELLPHVNWKTLVRLSNTKLLVLF